MGLRNSAAGYGALTKFYHWTIVALFAIQFVSASVMTRLGSGPTQDATYNWHKSIGLVALLVAVLRLANRRVGELPPWAPTLSEAERAFVHRAEQILYAAMLIMPLSGFAYVMTGGYGVRLFGAFDLPNPLPVSPPLATAAKWTHVLAGWALTFTVLGHVVLVLRHQVIHKDGLLARMLPVRSR
jgi:cytochrome b561